MMKYRKAWSLILAVVLIFGMMPAAFAVPDIDGGLATEGNPVQKRDNRMDPLTEKQLALRSVALQNLLKNGGEDGVIEVSEGQYVQLAREGDPGQIWTVLGEFADYPHNSIPEPDRTVNNTTIWTGDFSRDYYMDLLFDEAEGANSMSNYYIEQSSGRYSVAGDVTDWIGVPWDHDAYDDNPDANVWLFLEHSVNGWCDSMESEGWEVDDINAYLARFDVWDRYDYDGDGIFDEPDGYIDTFQSVHAGEGEEAGGGELGDEAIWSHSWYANYGDIGETGPEGNLMGGIQIGDSDYWIGKYTIQPENGGVGVFAHEYGHDMGLPDLYDYYGENGTGFWTLMSSGSWLTDNEDDIGSKPCHLLAWEKLQLGWLNYETIEAGEEDTFTLGPAEFNTDLPQAVIVNLDPKEVTNDIGTPYDGAYFYYSGMGNDLDHWMTKPFELSEGAALSAMVEYAIEANWDYAYVVVSTDGGDTWTSIETNLSTTTDPNGQNDGFGITGESRGWVGLTADLSAYGGQTVQLGFHYWTDGAAIEKGFLVDNIAVSGYEMDGAETDAGWVFDGFITTTGSETGSYANAYFCEYRTYTGYDDTLQVGPYNFGYNKYPDKVDHFSYQDGLLITYWDSSQADNDTALHPGHGLLLSIDSHFEPLALRGRSIWRNRIQTYDATFGLNATDGIETIHYNNKEFSIPSLSAEPLFDDTILHYDSANPLGSVIHPDTGTQIEVLGESVSPYGVPMMEIKVY